MRTSTLGARLTARRRLGFLGAAGLALGLLAASPSVATAKGTPYTCSGSQKSPGVLAGSYQSGVLVKGACEVKAGPVHVLGTLTLGPGSTMVAAFGRNHRTHHGGSSLTVTGDLVVGRGATLILGCKVVAGGAGFPCVDDPNMNKPTLTSAEHVSGSLIENAPLGVVVHNSTIGGNVKETGGGGALNCTPSGVFKAFKSPVYSDYEDSSVHGNLQVTGLKSCWLGVARVNVHGNLGFTNNKLADPDAIEIIANHVAKNLSCAGNSSVWDSVELSMPPATFPRGAEPNTVHGKRSGQCVLSTPVTMGGPSGPGAF